MASIRLRSTRLEIGHHRVFNVGSDQLPRLLIALRDDAVEHSVGETRYRMPAQQIADRLDLLGIGPAEAEAAFDAKLTQSLSAGGKDREVSDLDILYPDPLWEETEKRWRHFEDHARQELILLNLDLPKWISLVRAAAKREAHRGLMVGIAPDRIEWLVGLLRDLDCLIAFRLLLLAFPREEVTLRIPNDLLSQPLTNATTAVSDSLRAFQAAGSKYSPTVVLTEGSTDVAILRAALQVLYPHMSDLIKFMDFRSPAKPEGGASALVRMVKAFSSAGVSNRVVALFDNDTAAEHELRSLNQRDVADNIAIRRYPTLDLGREYPTVDPPGSRMSAGGMLRTTDVNGVACSIEMYVGRDVLTGDDGNLLPVELKGFDGRLGRYQGEVTNKRAIQRNFQRKAEAAIARGGPLPDEDWAELDRIIRIIIDAHHGQ
ncbi:hypothetical protein [Couchioplanes caeruleus]|uniref:hypothetical protein n=1 Tax=Couchioplanes caeruleus TaxID=56438 RepID=UPI001160B47B|nr:hypothetical protein [Couchioplanes caeruleus]